MLDNMELTEKATPAVHQTHAQPANAVKNEVIQPIGKDFSALARQQVDEQARQEQTQTPDLGANHEDRGDAQQTEQQPCAGSG